MKKQLNTESLRVALLEAGHAGLGRAWNYKRLASPYSRIYLIEKGEAWIQHNGTLHKLQEGDLHLVPCYVTADYSCPDQHSQFYTGFTMRLDTGSDLFGIQGCSYTLTANERHYAVFRRLSDLVRPFTEQFGRLSNVELPIPEAVEARGLVMQLAAAFLETAEEPTESELEREGRFAPILRFVDENLQRDISLDTLAEISSLTPTYFSDLFFKTMGVRPVEFVNRRRIERAQLLLASTDMTIQEIADAVGINSATYFSRLFNRISGLPPRRYRKLVMDV